MRPLLTRRESLEVHGKLTFERRDDGTVVGRITMGMSHFASAAGLPCIAHDLPVHGDAGARLEGELVERAWSTVTSVHSATSEIIAATLPEHIEHRGVPGRTSLPVLFASIADLRGWTGMELIMGLAEGKPKPDDVSLRLRASGRTVLDLREAMRRDPGATHLAGTDLVKLLGFEVVETDLPHGTWRLEVIECGGGER